jgi:hypothetical protein
METPAFSERSGRSVNQCGNSILRLPGSPLKNCATCGVPFRPVHQWHELCRQCWTYNRIGDACARFNAEVTR